MATAKMETAAERYRRIRKEKESAETLHDVHCSDCDMDWKCRRSTVDFWLTSGVLPMHLAETFIKAAKGETGGVDGTELIKTMATGEVMKSIEFASRVVRYTAVEPRIADVPKEPNDISPDEVLQCCYHKLLNWQMGGGDEAARLGNFQQ